MKQMLCLLISCVMIVSQVSGYALAEDYTEGADEVLPISQEEISYTEEKTTDVIEEGILPEELPEDEEFVLVTEPEETEESAKEELPLLDLDSEDSSATAGTDGAIEWALEGDVLILHGNGAMNNYSKGSAPWANLIRSGSVRSVQIENGVKSIGTYAFCLDASEKNEIIRVSLPAGLTSIGDGAFTRCKLTEISFPEGLEEIGKAAFSYNQLTSVAMPQNLQSIGIGCFVGNTGLCQVILNNNLKTIGTNAFQTGTIRMIEIPSSVEMVGNDIGPVGSALIFYGNKPDNLALQSNSTVYYLNGTEGWENYFGAKETFIGNGSRSQGTIGSVTYTISILGDVVLSGKGDIPAYTLGQAPWFAVLSTTEKASLTIGEEISSVGAGAFSGCTGIRTIIFLGTPTLIAGDAFEDVTAEVKYNCYARGTESSWKAVVGTDLGGSLTWTAMHESQTLAEKAPTCTESGLTEGAECTRCMQVLIEQELIEAKGHIAETIPGYAQTCETSGLTDGVSCKECKLVLLECKEIPAHFPVAEERVEPGCTSTGLTEGSHCAECSTPLVCQQVIPAVGHALQHVLTTVGIKEHWCCETCGALFLDSEGNEEVCADDLSYGVSIVYHLNGGENSISNPNHVDTEKGETRITLGYPEREGYLFDGWYLDELFVTYAPAPELVLEGKGTIELWAKWNPVTYDIVFQANGGNGKMNGVAALPYDENYVLAEACFCRKGYVFNGWNTEKDGSGRAFSDGQMVSRLTAMNREVITLYAQWELEHFTITYVLPEGALNTSENPNSYFLNTRMAIALKDPTGEECLGNFQGWYSDASFKTKVTAIKAGSIGDIVLYSKWSNREYSITYVMDDNCANDPLNPESYTSADSNITLKAPIGPEEYGKFAGWYRDAGFKTRVTGIRKGSAGDLVLYPKWSPLKYTVRYNLNGGINSKANPSYFTILTAPVQLEAPTRKGYDFNGWYLDEGLTQPVTMAGEALENITVYAGWTIKNYSIRFDSRGGSVVAPIEYQITSPSFRLPLPTRNGYTFSGWYKEPALKTRLISVSKGVGSDYVLYAKWTPNSYTIRFHANGGKGSTKAASAVYNNYVSLSSNRFIRNGYVFAGWNTSPDGTGAQYDPEARVINLSRSPKGIVTLYAQWKEQTFTIRYELNGGENAPANPSTYTISQTPILLSVPTREGYSFGGWYRDAKLRTVANLRAGTYGDLALYAKWVPIKG